jgi:hypothetical protein
MKSNQNLKEYFENLLINILGNGRLRFLAHSRRERMKDKKEVMTNFFFFFFFFWLSKRL